MGYYDEEREPSTSTGSHPELKRDLRQKNQRPWLQMLVSSIIGGLIVAVLVPGLATLNLLPYDVVPKNESTTSSETTQVNQAVAQQQTLEYKVEYDVIDAVEGVSDAIVGVVNIQEGTNFFSRSVQDVERGTGSGVIFAKEDDRAHIVTNYHVIEGAQRVEVSLANGERVDAQLKGADPLTDLAVLEIDGTHVDTVAEFGDSDSIRPGEPAIAIGNPLGLEFSRTVTQGIISARERSVEVSQDWEVNVIQTDAAINPGNSGGALINIQGQVIGINSLKIAQSGVEGLGFALPSNDVIPIIEDLVAHGEVQRPYMGVSIIDLTDVDSRHWTETLKLPGDINQGVVIRGTEAMSPADQAGFQELDVIVEINGEPIHNSMELRKFLFNKASIGETIEVKVYRGGLPEVVEVTLEASES
ncbi:S1C family serine protease [Caldalkalibacillus salinus]|uniref:S1C family serine protease n=1 Tax=Caldalkalibacillus salinus TaxID=2803787 RepID=UPI0019216994|nr:trypsin-like peptidase domain-containing protein [Caldalkalibacillus salinus]